MSKSAVSKFLDLDSHWGANMMAGATAFGAMAKAFAGIFMVALPYVYAYNGGWGYLASWYMLLVAFLWTLYPLIPISIGLMTPRIRAVLFESLGKKAEGEKAKIPGVSREAIGFLFGLNAVMIILWAFLILLQSIYVHWWLNTEGHTTYLENYTFGCGPLVDARVIVLYGLSVFYFIGMSIVEVALSAVVVMGYAVHTSPAEMAAGFQNFNLLKV